MNAHKNARLTVSGRELLVRRIENGWTVTAAAEAAGTSRRTVHKWLGRHRGGGERRLHDRSSAPLRCPRRTPQQRLDEIERLRRERKTAPKLARELGMAVWTAGAVLRRLGLGKVAALAPTAPAIPHPPPAPALPPPIALKT